MSAGNAFLFSAIATLAFVAGLFFLRFWRRSGDRFFLLFAVAFWLMALNRMALVLYSHTGFALHAAFGLRLLAHLILLAAIVDKNLRSPPDEAAGKGSG